MFVTHSVTEAAILSDRVVVMVGRAGSHRRRTNRRPAPAAPHRHGGRTGVPRGRSPTAPRSARAPQPMSIQPADRDVRPTSRGRDTNACSMPPPMQRSLPSSPRLRAANVSFVSSASSLRRSASRCSSACGSYGRSCSTSRSSCCPDRPTFSRASSTIRASTCATHASRCGRHSSAS